MDRDPHVQHAQLAHGPDVRDRDGPRPARGHDRERIQEAACDRHAVVGVDAALRLPGTSLAPPKSATKPNNE